MKPLKKQKRNVSENCDVRTFKQQNENSKSKENVDRDPTVIQMD